MTMRNRQVWVLLVVGCLAGAVRAQERPMFHVEFDASRPAITFLSWDTERGDRSKLNLLRHSTAVTAEARSGDAWKPAAPGEIDWAVRTEPSRLTMTFKSLPIRLHFPFDPLVCATTILPARWDDDGTIHFPAIASAPDFGQVRIAIDGAAASGNLIGSRSGHKVDFTVELAPPAGSREITIVLTPVILPMPPGFTDEPAWRAARRGWFNVIQPAAQWGDQGNRFSAPAGVLANNVVSDAVSCLLHQWADHILLTPPMPPDGGDIALPPLLRRTIDWWLEHRMKPSGEMIAYWDHADMLDANASPLIASWDYVEASGDRAWLARRIEKLEHLADYLVARDIDDDGLIESNHSGNAGTLIEPMRAGSAYDAINAGHKDAYCNALIYRAFRCLADLEQQLGRDEQAARYAMRADRLKAAYVKTFLNPQTGWLAWWLSADGRLHDLASPMINNVAICYGLVDPEQGKQILARIWAKIDAVGFKRFDLGVPITLVPIPRADYLIGLPPGAAGVPAKDDGSDTFGHYLNGGCMVNDAIYCITALAIVGEREKADRVLGAMLDRQRSAVFPNGGSFQNGVVNEYPRGAEFYTWDGTTCGYEGHLTYSFTFLDGLLLRDPAQRARLFRALEAPK